MIVRIRLPYGSPLGKVRGANRKVALMAASLMTPLSLMAWSLGFWRLGADLRWTEDFFIREGPLSRWQVWMAVAVMVQAGAAVLLRYARRTGLRERTTALF